MTPVSRIERFWTRLFLSEQGGPEVLKWVDFGRRLMLGMCAMVLLLGGGLSALAGIRTNRILEQSLRARAATICEATARAAFVPLSLENRAALRALAGEYEGQKDVAGLVILDASGRTWAELSRPPRGRGRLISVESPVLPPRSAGGPGGAIGRVLVEMSTAEVTRRLWADLGAALAINGAFILVVLSIGLVVIRNLTLNMQALVDEASWVAELRRSNRELEEFAYVASHDLQSPLRKVAGFAELLEEALRGRLDQDGVEFLGHIVNGTKRMQRLIEDLLTFSRAGSRQLELGRVDMGAVLREVLSDLDPLLSKAGAEVESRALPVLVADRRQMGQLLQNLIGNAVKYRAAAPPRVTVRAAPEGELWHFCVSDNGIGIEPQYADQIFKMFRRLHAAGAYEGTGIGLAIVRKIVERHGGRVWVESQAGRGSAFHFTLRAVTTAAPALAQGGDHGQQTGAGAVGRG